MCEFSLVLFFSYCIYEVQCQNAYTFWIYNLNLITHIIVLINDFFTIPCKKISFIQINNRVCSHAFHKPVCKFNFRHKCVKWICTHCFVLRYTYILHVIIKKSTILTIIDLNTWDFLHVIIKNDVSKARA